MLHRDRGWIVRKCQSNKLLAKTLIGVPFSLSDAFMSEAGTVWANDSASLAVNQEYVVLRRAMEGGWVQVDSVTVELYNASELASLISTADSGEFDGDPIDRLAPNQLQFIDIDISF